MIPWFVIAINLFSFQIQGEEEIKYPHLAQSIRCLVLVGQTQKTIPGKTIEIEKIYSAPEQFEYTVSAAIHSSGDYGTKVELESNGKFYQKSDVFELTIQVKAESLKNFENPLELEPFYVDYSFENLILNTQDKLTAKCLHRIY